MFYINIFPKFTHPCKNSTQIIGRDINTNCKAACVDSGRVDRIGFGSRVDGASKLLIDSALFLELREGGVSCSCGKVFVWSCVTQCKDPETPVLICSSRSPSRLHIIKIIPQPSTKSLFVTWLAWLSSVKSSPITVSGTMVYSKDHSP